MFKGLECYSNIHEKRPPPPSPDHLPSFHKTPSLPPLRVKSPSCEPSQFLESTPFSPSRFVTFMPVHGCRKEQHERNDLGTVLKQWTPERCESYRKNYADKAVNTPTTPCFNYYSPRFLLRSVTISSIFCPNIPKTQTSKGAREKHTPP